MLVDSAEKRPRSSKIRILKDLTYAPRRPTNQFGDDAKAPQAAYELRSSIRHLAEIVPSQRCLAYLDECGTTVQPTSIMMGFNFDDTLRFSDEIAYGDRKPA